MVRSSIILPLSTTIIILDKVMRPARFLLVILISILCVAGRAYSQGWTIQLTQTTALTAIDFVDTQTGWVVGEHPTGGGQPLPGMIFATQDGGQTWNMMIQNVPVLDRHFMGVDFIDHLSGWVCGEQGTIIYSSDGGQTWVDQTPGITNEDLRDIVFIDPWNGFAIGGNNAGIFSTDGGATWDTLTNLPPGNGLTRIQYIQGRLYTCGEDGQLYYSDDLGMSWFDRSLAGAPRIEGMKWVDIGTGFITLQFGQILMTVDAGMSWQSISPGGFGNLHAVDATDPNTIITSGQSDLILHTYDAGARWHTYSTGLRNHQLLDLAFVNPLDAWACGGRDFGTFQSRGFVAKWDGRAPVIFMPSVHNYDTLLCNIDDVDTLNVRNLGNKDLRLTSWKTVGTNLTEFSVISPSFPATIPPGGNIDLLVRWKPAGLGPKTAELQVFNDDLLRNPRRVHLTAYKDSSEIGISRTYVSFRNLCIGYSLEDSISLFAFGTVNPELISITKVSGDDVFTIFDPSTPRMLSFQTPTKIKFRFTPQQLKDYQATYRITATPCNRELYFVLSGQGAVTKLNATPAAIDFGKVELKDSVFREIYVTNVGNYEAKVTRYKLFPNYPNVTLRDSSLLPLNLGPHESKKYMFAFAPDSIHTVNAVLCLYWDEPCPDSVCIPIRGQGVAEPRIETDAFLQFPHSMCEPSVMDTLWVYNTGHKRLKITSASLVGDAKASFTIIEPSLPVFIPPVDSIAFVFKVNHDKPGPKVTTLRLVHNDSVNNPTEVVLIADKDDAIFSILGDTARVEQVCVGSDFARNFTIRNTGTVPITITDIRNLTNNANFTFSGLAPGATIKPGKSRQLRVTFSPATPGVQVLKLQISSSPCRYQHLMTVTMQGIETMFSRNPSTLNFGDVRIGEQSTLRIHLRNTGANARVAKILIRPSVAGLSITNSPKTPFTWRAGIQDSIEVTFAPGADGAMNTELLLIVDAACPDTIRIPILGTGTTSYLALSRSALPLLLDGCAFVPRCDTLLITNTGVSTVRIDSLFIRQGGAIFSLQSPPALPLRLSGGASNLLTICARPGFIGSEQGQLVVVSDDPQRPRIELPLLATRDSVNLDIDPRTIAFGNAAACDTGQAVTVTIRNTGTLSDSLTLDASALTAFNVLDPFPISLGPGETRTFRITFSPGTENAFSEILRLKSGICKKSIPITLTGIFANQAYTIDRSSVDYGDVAIGVSSTQIVKLTSSNKQNGRLKEIVFSPAASAWSTSLTMPFTVQNVSTTDIPVTFTPTDTVDYSATACLIFDQPCPDTICVTLSGKGVRGALAASATRIVFGELAQCESGLDTITVINTGTGDVTLTSATVMGAGASYYVLTNPLSGNEVLSPAASRDFYVAFNALSAPDGTHNAFLRIQSSDIKQPVMDIQLEGTRSTQTLPTIALQDFGNVALGQVQNRPITIANNGTARFCISSVVVTPPFSASATLPLCIDPGQSADVTVTFNPIDTLLSSGEILLVVSGPCPDTIHVRVLGQGTQGVVAQTLSLNMGAVASCLTRADTVVIRNVGGAPITLTQVQLTGPDVAQFGIVQQPSPPFVIDPGNSTIIIISFDPQGFPDGNKTASVLTTFDIGGKTQQFSTALRVVASTPAFNAAGGNLGMVTVGQSRNGSITITNTSQVPITVNSISIDRMVFSVAGTTPPLPAVLPPGGDLVVTVRFAPTAAGSITATLTASSPQPCPSTFDFSLTGEGVEREIVQAGLSIGNIQGRIDDVIDIPVEINADVGTAQVTSYTGKIRFNRTMLYPRAVVTAQTLSEGMSVNFSYDHVEGEVTISASGGTVRSGTGPLFVLKCLVLLGDNVDTPLEIDQGFDFTSGFARVVARANGLFHLVGYCLGNGNRLIRITGQNQLWQNHPNPFNPVTTIEYEIAEDGFVSLIVYDALGREVTRLVQKRQQAQRYQVEFDATGLPSGTYYYILRSGNYRASRKMIIAK